MNLVDIEIRQILKSITPLDPDFREPVSSAALSSVVIVRGQANLGNKRFERTFRTHTGDVAESEGHLVFRKRDLAAQGVTLQKGDRVTKIAQVATDLELLEIRPESPLRGEFLLVYAEFWHVREERASA